MGDTLGRTGYRGAAEIKTYSLSMKTLLIHIFAVRKPYLFIYLIKIQNRHKYINLHLIGLDYD